MVEHKCNKEKELTEMHTILVRLDKSLTGNGQPGLLNEFERFKGGLSIAKWFGGSAIFVSVITFFITVIRR